MKRIEGKRALFVTAQAVATHQAYNNKRRVKAEHRAPVQPSISPHFFCIKSNNYYLHKLLQSHSVFITFPNVWWTRLRPFSQHNDMCCLHPGLLSQLCNNSKRWRARRTLWLQHRTAADRPSPTATCRLTARVRTSESERFKVDLEVRPCGVTAGSPDVFEIFKEDLVPQSAAEQGGERERAGVGGASVGGRRENQKVSSCKTPQSYPGFSFFFKNDSHLQTQHFCV